MEKRSMHLKIHPHSIVEEEKSLISQIGKPFKIWECVGRTQNPSGCKSIEAGQIKITDSSIPKYICEMKCQNFFVCGSCAKELQDIAILPEIVEWHGLHSIHPLYRCYNAKDQWICNAKNYLGCMSNMKSQFGTDGQERYNCKKCNFDLCAKCLFFYADHPETMQLYQVNSSIHEHVLTRWFDDNGWCCDGSKVNLEGCESGITGFGETTNMNRWRCSKCDFDICEKCLQTTIIDACPFQSPLTREQFQESHPSSQ